MGCCLAIESRYHLLLSIRTEDGWCLAQLVKILSVIAKELVLNIKL